MPTEKLYYLDPYLKTFTARVLSCDPGKNGYLVTLDRTAFYPEGGGQPCDLGTLGQAKVLDVQEKDGTVFHTVDIPVEIGAALPGAIDWDRRFDHMQQHSGEHIVSGMLCARFACDNVGFHMGEDLVTIDYNADIPWDALLEVEAAANRYLWEDHPVDIRLHRGEELSAIDYRSKKAIPGDVRIVTFPGADCCACCGTHVKTSAEVGLVKFLSVQKFRQGVRIELLCGGRAQRYLSRCWEQSRLAGQALSVKPTDLAPAVDRLQLELTALKEKTARLEEQSFARIAAQYAGAGDVLLITDPLEGDGVRRLCDAVSKSAGGRCAVFSGTDGAYRYALISTEDVSPLVKAMNQSLSGRGGGRNGFAQGSAACTAEAIRAFFAGI